MESLVWRAQALQVAIINGFDSESVVLVSMLPRLVRSKDMPIQAALRGHETILYPSAL